MQPGQTTITFLWSTLIRTGMIKVNLNEANIEDGCLLRDALKGLGVSKINSQVCHEWKFADCGLITQTANCIQWQLFICSQSSRRKIDNHGSGAIQLADPRAGAGMTFIPGARMQEIFIWHPSTGAFLLFPGWLHASLMPVSVGDSFVLHHIECEFIKPPLEFDMNPLTRKRRK